MRGGIFDQMGDRVKMKQDLMRKSYQVSTQRDTLMQIPVEEISQINESKKRIESMMGMKTNDENSVLAARDRDYRNNRQRS